MNPLHRRQCLTRSARALSGLVGMAAWPLSSGAQTASPRMQAWPLATPRPTGIHDLAPAPDGGVWFSAQRSGHLGWFEPRSGQTEVIAPGAGLVAPRRDSRP